MTNKPSAAPTCMVITATWRFRDGAGRLGGRWANLAHGSSQTVVVRQVARFRPFPSLVWATVGDNVEEQRPRFPAVHFSTGVRVSIGLARALFIAGHPVEKCDAGGEVCGLPLRSAGGREED